MHPSQGDEREMGWDNYHTNEDYGKNRLDIASEEDILIEQLVSNDVYQRTTNAITMYTYCFIAHALLVEAPLAVVEGCIRSIIGVIFVATVAIFGLVCVILSLLDKPCGSDFGIAARLCIRVGLVACFEVAITIAGAISLAVPFVILFVYREFNGVDDWSLHPIPSVVGFVDPRRFAVVTLGQGNSATNKDMKLKGSSKEVMDSISFNGDLDSASLCFPRQVLLLLRESRRTGGV